MGHDGQGGHALTPSWSVLLLRFVKALKGQGHRQLNRAKRTMEEIKSFVVLKLMTVP